HATKWKSARTRAQFLTSLAQHVYPVFGSLPVSAIDTGLVLQVLEPMWAERTDLAQRGRTRIGNVRDWATRRGYRNPTRRQKPGNARQAGIVAAPSEDRAQDAPMGPDRQPFVMLLSSPDPASTVRAWRGCSSWRGG